MENHYNCIYMYVNKVNGKRYVGQAKDFNRRHRGHISESRKEHRKEYNYPFNKAIRKYGIENFEIIILKENLSTKCLLNLLECYYIKKYNTLKYGNGYNISDGGSNGNTFAGKTKEEMDEIWNNEHRRNLSESLKGRIFTECHKIKLSESRKGQPSWNKGKNMSEQSKRKLSESRKNKYIGKNHPNLGLLIERWDKQGNLIDIKYQFEYGKMGFNQGHICNCCKFWEMNCNKEEWFKTHKERPVRSHKGFVFKYHETE